MSRKRQRNQRTPMGHISGACKAETPFEPLYQELGGVILVNSNGHDNIDSPLKT